MVLKTFHLKTLVLCSSTATTSDPNNYKVINNHINPPVGRIPTTFSEATTSSSRPIPPPPDSFYNTVLESSAKTGLQLAGVPAPRGLGGGPIARGSTSNDHERWKGLTGGPDVSVRASSDGPKTVEEAAKFMARGVAAPLIDRSVMDSHDSLMEKAFMESSLVKPDDEAPVKPTRGRRAWDFVRDPMPWIKKTLLGLDVQEDEPEGFREIAYYHQPKTGMDKSVAPPSFYHGEETIDLQRKHRLERQAVAEVWEFMSPTTEHGKPLHEQMNNVERSTGSSFVLREAAKAQSSDDGGTIDNATSEQHSTPKSQQLETSLHPSDWFRWMMPLFEKRGEDHKTVQTLNVDTQLVNVIGYLALLVLACSAGTVILDSHYDFIGDSKPSIDAFTHSP